MTKRGGTIIGLGGTMLGPGDKVPCELAMSRASNPTRRIFDAWFALRTPGGAAPSLVAWDASGAVPDLQSSILIVEILPDTKDYRYLRIGKRAAELRGYDPTGMTVRGIYTADALDFVLENYDLAVAHPCGIVDFSVDIIPDDRHVELETMLLPLSKDGTVPSHVLVYGHYITK
ncbi:PAS domain-containing protein [Dongia rigui]|uniref:PAS domain-containing protein n=1 Tax=Dongia rigui TaxID=940149 RepID=A0ABU5E4J9_9PROT|nr:hypothetical protein [Dongia rigui]MDY0874099.1 hypothetical protein [Dongia rigui]